MAYTDNPTGSFADLVRLKTGDTGESPLLSDEAIEAFLLNNENNILLASAEACEALAAHYADNPTETVGDIEAAATKTQNFLRAADRYRAQAAAEKAEAEKETSNKPRRPGYSTDALNRGSVFKRGVCSGN